MLDFVLRGGLLMLPIFVCSFISLGIIMERIYHFYKIRINTIAFTTQLKKAVKENNMKLALKLCKKTNNPIVKTAEACLKNYNTREEMENAVKMSGSSAIRDMEKNLKGLAIIGNITPLLGILGTVTGMIKAFIKIQELGGKVDSSVLAGGIWEALITTAAGLTVAIPTLVFYHIFESKIDNYTDKMKEVSYELSSILKQN